MPSEFPRLPTIRKFLLCLSTGFLFLMVFINIASHIFMWLIAPGAELLTALAMGGQSFWARAGGNKWSVIVFVRTSWDPVLNYTWLNL